MKVLIYPAYEEGFTKVIVMDKQDNKRFVHNLYTGVVQEIKEYKEIPSEFIMKIPDYIVGPFFKAFAEAINEQGIKTKMDARIEGELDATKYHLEDLRMLLHYFFKEEK